MEKHRRNAVDTRRMYAMEKEYLQPVSPIIGMHELRWLGMKVWWGEGMPASQFPRIVAGRGMWYLGTWTSYCDTAQKPMEIVLCYKHRRPATLIHELTHALGYFDHDRAFVNRYFGLLEKYGRFDKDELTLIAGWFKIEA